MPNETITIVLADEPGEGLGSMTRNRAKAAVPFGGEYRVIDFALSNCLHSGLRRVLVLMGPNSYSLQKHLRDGWSIFNPELREFITPVPYRSEPTHSWDKGTAGHLADYLHVVRRSGARRVLIMNGSHVYRMDLAAMIAHHRDRGLDATVAYVEVDGRRAQGRPLIAVERPDSGDARATGIVARGPASAPESPARVLMGVYLIEMDVLVKAMARDGRSDRSGGDLELDVVHAILRGGRAGAYRFGGPAGRVSQDRYWNDMASLDEYFNANLALLEPVSPLDLYQDDWPIWSRAERNPPARTVEGASGNEGLFVNSIVSNGTVIRGGTVSRSVVFPRVRVEDGASVERSILCHGAHIGAGSALRNCIVDKHVQVPAGVRIGFDIRQDGAHFETTPNGVVMVSAGSVERLSGGAAA